MHQCLSKVRKFFKFDSFNHYEYISECFQWSNNQHFSRTKLSSGIHLEDLSTEQSALYNLKTLFNVCKVDYLTRLYDGLVFTLELLLLMKLLNLKFNRTPIQVQHGNFLLMYVSAFNFNMQFCSPFRLFTVNTGYSTSTIHFSNIMHKTSYQKISQKDKGRLREKYNRGVEFVNLAMFLSINRTRVYSIVLRDKDTPTHVEKKVSEV